MHRGTKATIQRDLRKALGGEWKLSPSHKECTGTYDKADYEAVYEFFKDCGFEPECTHKAFVPKTPGHPMEMGEQVTIRIPRYANDVLEKALEYAKIHGEIENSTLPKTQEQWINRILESNLGGSWERIGMFEFRVTIEASKNEQLYDFLEQHKVDCEHVQLSEHNFPEEMTEIIVTGDPARLLHVSRGYKAAQGHAI